MSAAGELRREFALARYALCTATSPRRLARERWTIGQR